MSPNGLEIESPSAHDATDSHSEASFKTNFHQMQQQQQRQQQQQLFQQQRLSRNDDPTDRACRQRVVSGDVRFQYPFAPPSGGTSPSSPYGRSTSGASTLYQPSALPTAANRHRRYQLQQHHHQQQQHQQQQHQQQQHQFYEFPMRDVRWPGECYPLQDAADAVATYGGRYPAAVSVAIARRNERERNRVKTINQTFSRLRQHLPAVGSVGGGTGCGSGRSVGGLTTGAGRSKKLSKVQILQSAIAYINHLRKILAASSGEEDYELEEDDKDGEDTITDVMDGGDVDDDDDDAASEISCYDGEKYVPSQTRSAGPSAEVKDAHGDSYTNIHAWPSFWCQGEGYMV